MTNGNPSQVIGSGTAVASLAGRTRFYLQRARHASLAELSYRARQAYRHYRLNRWLRRGALPWKMPPVNADMLAALVPPALVGEVTTDRLERILSGEVETLGAPLSQIREYEDQHRCRFSPTISLRTAPVDIRALWEPARLQHLVPLLVYLQRDLEGEDAFRIREFIVTCLRGWLDRNRFLHGPNYLSAMECGLRQAVFFLILKMDGLPTTDGEAVLREMYRTGCWIEENLSLHSSLGNHTVCECVGLVFAGAVFRDSVDGRRWLQRGITLLQQELPHQIVDDGGPAEQAFGYHRFVLDLYWLVTDFLQRNNLHDCGEMVPRLLLGENFLTAFGSDSGNPPAIGDSDDGVAMARGFAPRRSPAQPVTSAPCTTFSRSGYSIIRSADFCLTFDHGPLGMAPLYNHGHADALSITLSCKGRELLVDPGTYRYNGVPEWRRYFKGTRAHNTVTIDDLDQAVQETGFIWSSPFTGRLVRKEETGTDLCLEAEHDGYRRLRQPVIHRRELLVRKGGTIVIKDTFSGSGIHHYALHYHFHPQAEVLFHEDWWQVRRGESAIWLRLCDAGSFNHCRGQESPPLGWYSSAYGSKEPCSVLHACREGRAAEVTFVTAISPAGPVAECDLQRLLEVL